MFSLDSAIICCSPSDASPTRELLETKILAKEKTKVTLVTWRSRKKVVKHVLGQQKKGNDSFPSHGLHNKFKCT